MKSEHAQQENDLRINSRQARHFPTADLCMDISQADHRRSNYVINLTNGLFVCLNLSSCPCSPTASWAHIKRIGSVRFPNPLTQQKKKKKGGQQHQCQPSSVGVALTLLLPGDWLFCVLSQWWAWGPGQRGTQEMGGEKTERMSHRDLV